MHVVSMNQILILSVFSVSLLQSTVEACILGEEKIDSSARMSVSDFSETEFGKSET